MCSDDEGESIALAYTAEGYQSFVLQYTLGGTGGFQEVLEDVDWAIQTIIEHVSGK